MKQRIVAFILVLGIVLGMGVEGTEARAAEPEPTPPSQEKTITSIEVVDTDVEIPYKSVFTKNNVAIKLLSQALKNQLLLLLHKERSANGAIITRALTRIYLIA